MKCKNCGARVDKDSSICTNCGAAVNSESDYVLLTNKDNIYRDVMTKKRRNRISYELFVLLSIVIIFGAGLVSYLFFYSIDIQRDKPSLAFESGYGVINDDEPIIYVTIKDASSVDLIHGVNLYDSVVDESTLKKPDPVATEYKYSKNVDEAIRTIFFDMDDLDLDENSNYTYTFEMTYSFVDDENHYSYYVPVNFKGTTSADVNEKVFDHSMVTNPIPKETTTAIEETTVSNGLHQKKDYEFLYNAYWYTAPYQQGDYYSISAFKFKDDGSFITTDYSKNGDDYWKINTNSGHYKIKDGVLTIETDDKETDEFTINIKKKEVRDSADNQLVSRNFNSLKNTEDFFGM